MFLSFCIGMKYIYWRFNGPRTQRGWFALCCHWKTYFMHKHVQFGLKPAYTCTQTHTVHFSAKWLEPMSRQQHRGPCWGLNLWQSSYHMWFTDVYFPMCFHTHISTNTHSPHPACDGWWRACPKNGWPHPRGRWVGDWWSGWSTVEINPLSFRVTTLHKLSQGSPSTLSSVKYKKRRSTVNYWSGQLQVKS